jgi:hypothetical protein
MTIREKNLGVVVIFLCLMIILWGLKHNWNKKLERTKEDLVSLQDRLEQTKKLLTLPEAPAEAANPAAGAPAEAVDTHDSLFLLRDLTASDLSQKLRIVSATRNDSGVYQVEVEGEFQELMRFMSFLERQDGKFLLQTAKFRRAGDGGNGGPAGDVNRVSQVVGPSRRVVATFHLGMKG